MRYHIAESLLAASVNSHLTDPQAKWTTSIATGNLIAAFVDASGVDEWVANIVVMEKCADHWLGCLADISRSYLRPNLASHPFVVSETSTRSNGDVRTDFKQHRVSGALTRLVEDFNNPYAKDAEERSRMDIRSKCIAFWKFAYETLHKNPDLLSAYDNSIQAYFAVQIADHLTASEMRAIDAEIKRTAEEADRAAAAARERRAAEDAARAKRAAAAAARKARAAKGGVA